MTELVYNYSFYNTNAWLDWNYRTCKNITIQRHIFYLKLQQIAGEKIVYDTIRCVEGD